ncbi:AfsR/SARP family transcriptional regulator [Nonomuraea candida]|uniref:AfsR/SARP family transcriptional regulator n=1 Tax=Nonomuraea candida TaxID=359159 RepID=UPI0009FC3370|nr:AfsR/SARP family transcriptional regulator [Nonomuraea candida]
MEFRLLGALEVTGSGKNIELGGTRQQITLATLLLNADRPVALSRLMEAIYGDEPPATSRAQVQICISGLRRLFEAHGDPNMIVTRPQGYALRADPDKIDARVFESLLAKARKLRDTRDLEGAIQHYRRALGLWRGPALDGIESRLLQSIAGQLTEQRITANEDCIQLELELGRHHELVGELTGLVSVHPLRERFIAQLMTALYRSGRQAESLQVYRDARRMMIDELGIEPNEQLQQLESAILTADDSLDAPPPPPAQIVLDHRLTHTPVPGMLPAGIADFIGRQDQIDAIKKRLTESADGAARFALPIVAIAGRAGIGKTTVAVHAAHSVAAHFPDGQLFAHMHGGVSRPVSPMQVLERFLRALGVSGTALPETLEERAEMYRMLLADRRMLIVLDDAASESQVIPLLPGNPDSAVIVTSRSRLGGLAGATQVNLDLFDSAQSIDLLSRIAGADRVEAEPEAAAALAGLCGHLPLALRIAGARMVARPHWGVEQLVERLRDEARRLDELMHGEMGIRASLSLTYEAISEPARRLFRRLAILDAHIFSAWTSAALLDEPLADVQDLLDDLADAQLIEVLGTGRHVGVQYRFHDLIRVYARERLAAEETPAMRADALARVLRALLHLTMAARRQEYGPSPASNPQAEIDSPLPDELVERLVAKPIAWFERERHVLLAGIRQAAQAGFVELCWRLAMNAEAFFELRVYLDDWRETHEIALEAARAGEDKRGQAEMLYARGSLSLIEQRFDDAARDFESALALFREIGDELQTARTTRDIAVLERMNGQMDRAMERLEQALKIFSDIGDQIAAAHTLHNLAQIRVDCDDIDGAKMLLTEALVRSRSGGNRRVTAQVLHRMGHVHLRAREVAIAAGTFEESLAVVQEIGDTIGEAFALHGFGVARLRQGRLAEAEPLLRDALTRAKRSRHRLAEAHALSGLGELWVAAGKASEAADCLHKAATLFRQMRIPLLEAQTLLMLCEVVDEDAAAMARSRVRELLDQVGHQAGESLREHLAASAGPPVATAAAPAPRLPYRDPLAEPMA